jgi:hemerythrin-like domain-containing protein
LKRHRSLHPLSEHHHHALIQALLIRRADEGSAEQRKAALRETAENLVRFWKVNGRQHFRQEEEILLPAYARHVPLDQNPAVMRMLAEHASIRGQVEELERALASDELVEDDVIALGKLLQRHVRLEEDQIFPAIEAALSEEEMAALGDRFTWLHRECEIEEKGKD